MRNVLKPVTGTVAPVQVTFMTSQVEEVSRYFIDSTCYNTGIRKFLRPVSHSTVKYMKLDMIICSM